MKKNKMMRTASGLLALTLLTTGVISGTFAKYTTEDSAYDVARVAKWGVTLQAVGSLYGDKYLAYGDNQAGGNKATTTDKGITVEGTQLSNVGTAGVNDEAVVAPGTYNDNGFSFALNGKPEVTSTLKATIKSANIMLAKGEYGVMVELAKERVTAQNFDSLGTLYQLSGDTYTKVNSYDDADKDKPYYTLEDYYADNENDYYPVVYSLDGNTKNDTADRTYTKDTIGDISKKIATALNDKVSVDGKRASGASYTYSVEKEYKANTEFTDLELGGETITWAWAYERSNESKVGDNASATDKADTILGNLMAETVDKYPTEATDKDFKGTVVKGSLNSGSFTKVDVQEEEITVSDADSVESNTFYNYYATVGDTVVANLSTYFSIDIAVTQVD